MGQRWHLQPSSHKVEDLPSEDMEAPDNLNKSDPICMGKTFSGGRIEGGWPDGVRLPLFWLEPCDELDGTFNEGWDAEAVDGFVFRFPASSAVRCLVLCVLCISEEAGSSPGEAGSGPVIRSKLPG